MRFLIITALAAVANSASLTGFHVIACTYCNWFPTTTSACGNLWWKGDGWCDDVNNFAACDWDGGDCCHNCGNDWNVYCQICECLDPNVNDTTVTPCPTTTTTAGIPCPDDCTDDSHGSCDLATGTCTCVLGFKGDNCAVSDCSEGYGGTACCTSSNQCAMGEGDCDADDDCTGSLKCGQANGLHDNCDNSLGFPSNYDCCYEPEATGCADGTDGECCEGVTQCGIGEGDCDSDAGCIGSLKCGSNNCDTSLGFGPSWDCCYDDGYTPEVTGCADGSDGSCCTTSNLCGIGDGDCDSDDQCQDDLLCGSNNCDTSLGFGPNWDCCE